MIFKRFVILNSLLGAPLVERTQDNQNVKLALSFVTAAVAGVIANLGIYTAKAVLFTSGISGANLNWFALAWILISVIALRKCNINMIVWIAISALLGIVLRLFLV